MAGGVLCGDFEFLGLKEREKKKGFQEEGRKGRKMGEVRGGRRGWKKGRKLGRGREGRKEEGKPGSECESLLALSKHQETCPGSGVMFCHKLRPLKNVYYPKQTGWDLLDE